MPYLLDANVFIQAKNLHYGFEFCPAFWNWLQRENDAGVVFSVERVQHELMSGADELARWASAQGSEFFLKADSGIVSALRKVSQWVTSQDYEPGAVHTFLQVADYYLVAHAVAHDAVVVTHEIASSSTRRIKIPDVCLGLNVECVTPFEMLRVEQARFILGPEVPV